MITCRICAQAVPEDAILCPACGRRARAQGWTPEEVAGLGHRVFGACCKLFVVWVLLTVFATVIRLDLGPLLLPLCGAVLGTFATSLALVLCAPAVQVFDRRWTRPEVAATSFTLFLVFLAAALSIIRLSAG